MPSSGISRVGWVVDVQNDFMLPEGRLYVRDLADAADPGAQLARPAIERTVRWMREHCAITVFTGDWHGYGDREIDPTTPNARVGTYPPHCMGLSPNEHEREGARLLASIAPADDVLTLPRDVSDDEARRLGHAAIRERRPVFVQKSEFSVFEGNRASAAFVETLMAALGHPAEFVVCGVATDVCVRYAVEGLLDRGLPVRVVTDATWGLGLLGPEQTFEAWQKRGAALTLVDRLGHETHEG
jgi:nicotinamidase/pyrazinamidase